MVVKVISRRLNHVKQYDGKLEQTFCEYIDPFSEIMVADHGMCNHDLRNEIEVLVKHLFSFPVAIFNMMKLLAILEDEAGKTLINSN